MRTKTLYFKSQTTEKNVQSQYEVIENETLKDINFSKLVFSGSLFSLTTFINVAFDSCVFYGSKIENCEFINCTFTNCSFQFSSINYSKFQAASLAGCKWDYTPIKKTILERCIVDNKTVYFFSKDSSNQINHCYSSRLKAA